MKTQGSNMNSELYSNIEQIVPYIISYDDCIAFKGFDLLSLYVAKMIYLAMSAALVRRPLVYTVQHSKVGDDHAIVAEFRSADTLASLESFKSNKHLITIKLSYSSDSLIISNGATLFAYIDRIMENRKTNLYFDYSTILNASIVEDCLDDDDAMRVKRNALKDANRINEALTNYIENVAREYC